MLCFNNWNNEVLNRDLRMDLIKHFVDYFSFHTANIRFAKSRIWGGYKIPRRRGRQPSIAKGPHFPKNCMKLRKFWSVGGCAPGSPPLGSTTENHFNPRQNVGINGIYTIFVFKCKHMEFLNNLALTIHTQENLIGFYNGALN